MLTRTHQETEGPCKGMLIVTVDNNQVGAVMETMTGFALLDEEGQVMDFGNNPHAGEGHTREACIDWAENSMEDNGRINHQNN